MKSSVSAHWAALDDHFENHVRLVGRFKEAGEDAVLLMWQSQTNEIGEPLSQFERDALIERHCELFGTWPYVCKPHAAQAADLKRVDLFIAEGRQRIADQRGRLAKQECLGRDTRLSKRVLLTLEASLMLMVEYRYMLTQATLAPAFHPGI